MNIITNPYKREARSQRGEKMHTASSEDKGRDHEPRNKETSRS